MPFERILSFIALFCLNTSYILKYYVVYPFNFLCTISESTVKPETVDKPEETVDQTENPENTDESTEAPVTADEKIPVNSDDSPASEEDSKTSEKPEEASDDDNPKEIIDDDVFEDSTESTPHSEL